MPKCVYNNCNSTTKSKKCATLRFKPFPKPKTNLGKCLLWLDLCGNKKVHVSNITKNTYVCQKHFCDDRMEIDPIPFYETSGEDIRKYVSTDIEREIEVNNNEDNNEEYKKLLQLMNNDSAEYTANNEHNYSRTLNTPVIYANKSTQTLSRNLFSKNEEQEPIEASGNIFSFSSLSKSKHFRYFTGLLPAHFEALFQVLDPAVMPSLKYTRRNKTPVKSKVLKRFTDKDKLCLTLIRLKRGYTLKELSVFYNCSVGYISIIFHTWIQFMHFQLCGLRNSLFKGSRNMKKNDIPACFRAFEEKITVILDSTEIRMQMSRNFQRQGNTHSSYKHQNSVKFLIGVSPKGAIIYTSEGYEGCISDRELFKLCDIKYFLEEGDVIMADRGFTIQDICDENNYKLLIPPFMAGRCKLTAEEEISTKKIAKGRIHVERAIQRIKTYQLLAKPITITMLPLISNIFTVICFLGNFEKVLVT